LEKLQTLRIVPCLAVLLTLLACDPPKPTTPSLLPETAGELLHYSAKAETWLMHVRKQDPSCEYKLDLPDQSSHPTEIDLDHIVRCGGRPSSREFDASVSFEYDRDARRWIIRRFAS